MGGSGFEIPGATCAEADLIDDQSAVWDRGNNEKVEWDLTGHSVIVPVARVLKLSQWNLCFDPLSRCSGFELIEFVAGELWFWPVGARVDLHLQQSRFR